MGRIPPRGPSGLDRIKDFSISDLIVASIHDEYDFGVSEDRNRTVVYSEFIYTRKIDKKYAQIASDRIHHEYSSG